VSNRLVTPQAAVEQVARKVARHWADAVCAEQGPEEPFHVAVSLSPGVTNGSVVAAWGFDLRYDWTGSWREVSSFAIPGVEVRDRTVSVGRVREQLPSTLSVTGLDAALALIRSVGVELPTPDVGRARRVAAAMLECRAVLTPATLRAMCRLADADVEVATNAIRWRQDHPDVGRWTARALPVPGMHSKWLEKHWTLLRDLIGRDLRDEVRPRLAVAHLTYVDPAYLAAGGRRHDAWTTGDAHDLAYDPRTVLVVENRDCRLWFPPVEGTVVIEGGGKAAASLLAGVPWIRHATTVGYWGDIDADGYAILDRFREAMSVPGEDGAPAHAVMSVLMDATALDRYSHLGVVRDADGRAIPPSAAHLPHLTADETAAYYAIATAGDVPVRRIEQERMPIEAAASALVVLLDRVVGPGPASA
jgi:hypothetical protein